jgi:anaerobic magnesium-protoporphyrin IX monomethyl ester cyclase
VKVLLLNPNPVHLVNRLGKIYNRVWPPLELANCAALLEAEGHDVAIIDANALKMGMDDLIPRVAGFDKVFVSSSSLDRWQCPALDIEPFVNTARRVRSLTDDVFVLGVHGTLKPEEFLRLTGARAVVRGEPELTVSEICQGKPLADIDGLAFAESGKTVITADRRPLDLDRLPKPAFHLLPMDKYFYEVLGPRFTLFEGSRGCAAHCTFCLLTMYGRGIRRKSVAKLIEEVDDAIARFGLKTAYFMDLEFTVLRKQVMELCDHLIKKRCDFRWTCQTRFDLVDEPLLDKMRQAGCRLIHFGVEGGTDRLLDKIQKKITIREIKENMRLVRRAGIDTACFFMLGFPAADEGEMDETISLARQLNPTYALFHIVTPYPGTPLHEEILSRDPEAFGGEMFPEACLRGEDLTRLKKTIRRAYLSYYFRPRYLAARLAKGDFRALSGQVKLFLGYLS